MIRQYVNSSDLQSVGYEGNTLEIAFNSGGVYQYLGVPYQTYVSLMTAASHGKYFHQFIKDRYAYRKIA